MPLHLCNTSSFNKIVDEQNLACVSYLHLKALVKFELYSSTVGLVICLSK